VITRETKRWRADGRQVRVHFFQANQRLLVLAKKKKAVPFRTTDTKTPIKKLAWRRKWKKRGLYNIGFVKRKEGAMN